MHSPAGRHNGPCPGTRLNELRLTVQEEHLAIAVELGRYDQAAAEPPALEADTFSLFL